jgi:hypothetical protein
MVAMVGRMAARRWSLVAGVLASVAFAGAAGVASASEMIGSDLTAATEHGGDCLNGDPCTWANSDLPAHTIAWWCARYFVASAHAMRQLRCDRVI